MRLNTSTLALWAFLGLGASATAQNVGIGVAAPLERLHVAGGIRANTLAGVNSRLVMSDANGTLTNLAAGTANYVLTQGAAAPQWADPNNLFWRVGGNTLTAVNTLGTNSAHDLPVVTAGVERMRVTTGGRVGIGLTAPTTSLEVSSGAADAIYGHSNSVGGYLGRETNISFGTPVQTLLGAGVYANNPAAGYTSTYAQSTGAATVAAAISFSDVWIASYNYVENPAASTFNPSALYGQLNNSSTALGGFQASIRGYSNRGATAGNPGYTVGGQFTANAQNQDGFGVIGQVYTNTTFRAGGYFEAFNYAGASQAYAYVGSSVGGVNRKITGTAAVSEIVPTAEHGRVTLTCPESPEYWYIDYGTVQLVNGRAHVELDEILADIIVVDANSPYRVFCTPEDMLEFNGVAVVNRTATGFDLVELNGGTHSGTLQYQLVAKPKTGYGEGRFPLAPGPAYLKPENDPARRLTQNIPNPENIFQWPADHEVYGYDPAALTPIGQMVPAGPHAGKWKIGENEYSDHLPAERPAAVTAE